MSPDMGVIVAPQFTTSAEASFLAVSETVLGSEWDKVNLTYFEVLS